MGRSLTLTPTLDSLSSTIEFILILALLPNLAVKAPSYVILNAGSGWDICIRKPRPT